MKKTEITIEYLKNNKWVTRYKTESKIYTWDEIIDIIKNGKSFEVKVFSEIAYAYVDNKCIMLRQAEFGEISENNEKVKTSMSSMYAYKKRHHKRR